MLSPSPSKKLVAVTTPVTFIPAVNVAAVPVMMLSVDATPVRPDPLPTKEVAAVTTPVALDYLHQEFRQFPHLTKSLLT